MARVYMHEYIDITGHQRANYFEHVTNNWIDGAADRKMKWAGVWGTVGSTGRWPEVVNLWEYESWDVFAASLDHEVRGKGLQEPKLEKWWAEAQPMRRGGFDRVLVPASYSPSIDESIAAGVVGYRVFRHEIITTKAGSARVYLEKLEREWLPTAKQLGMVLFGAFFTSMRDDTEVILIWAIKDFATWGRVEAALDNGAAEKWRASVRDIATDQWCHIMSSAPQSPTATGVQPTGPKA